MQNVPRIDPDLIRRLDVPGPRYTSYPTAPHFSAEFPADALEAACEGSAGPVSVYVHVPFCHSPCFYCGCNKIVTRNAARGRPYLDDLRTELDRAARWFGGREMQQLHLGGGTPTWLHDDELRELVAAIDATFSRPPDGGERSIEIDPRTCGEGRMAALAGMGFDRISLGVQDLDPDVQAAVNRVQSFEEIAARFAEARAAGFRSISIDLIYGLPRQDPARFARTLALILSLAPDRLSLFSYAHLPERFPAQRGIETHELPDADDKLAMLVQSLTSLTDAGYHAIGMDHFAREGDDLVTALRDGTLQRNFQGYSTHGGRDLIGLGASAISQIGRTYSQNVADPQAYHDRVAATGEALARGVVLSDDDLLRRSIIMTLMCRDALDFDAFAARHGVDLREDFAAELDALRALTADGLVEVDARAITVTPLGHLFRRRLAMVFDAYLGGAGVGGPRYSRVV